MTLYYKRGNNADGWTDGFSALYGRLSQGTCLGYLKIVCMKLKTKGHLRNSYFKKLLKQELMSH